MRLGSHKYKERATSHSPPLLSHTHQQLCSRRSQSRIISLGASLSLALHPFKSFQVSIVSSRPEMSSSKREAFVIVYHEGKNVPAHWSLLVPNTNGTVKGILFHAVGSPF
ncbi:hypothetical protein BU23DRAFT_268968 [Bimuria novae-zelandiae CBS 107.79]|uniref:Uncharacterized protein n=1 Tax=Bimuria novae-zelandiae CBS 107.79 TaxID=1447943 RepID=A0A6A5UTB2_9PLEO|nr:hypothetical protein BU23DRAFT_268968 [Bimuria novae-zelandiae CBS 107.79]